MYMYIDHMYIHIYGYIQDIGSVAPVTLKQSRSSDPEALVDTSGPFEHQAWLELDLGASGMACRG